jgi:hypothetical protein
MNDIRATFEHDATLPSMSKSMSNFKSFFPSAEGFRSTDLDEARAANGFTAAAVNSQNTDHLEATAAVGRKTVVSSRPWDYRAKEWDAIFSKNRSFQDEPWKERLRRRLIIMDEDDDDGDNGESDDSGDDDENSDDDNNDDDNDNDEDGKEHDFGIFPRDFGDSGDFSVLQEVEKFCQDATLGNLEAGTDLAGRRRAAWLDDRSFYGGTNNRTRSRCNRKYEIPLTATGLYRQLKVPVCVNYHFHIRRL